MSPGFDLRFEIFHYKLQYFFFHDEAHANGKRFSETDITHFGTGCKDKTIFMLKMKRVNGN